MKKFLRSIKARVIYLIFGLALVMFVCVLLKKDNEFQFRNGEVMSKADRIVARFTAFVVATATGYIAFKTARIDWELWKRKRLFKSKDS
ncbi:MAG: hypothetical protein ABSE97_01275 [Verrucomicrobiota bacterium]|jgi:hypothetical protein